MIVFALIAGLQKFHFPPLKKCVRCESLKIRAEGVPWAVDCYRYYDADTEHYEAAAFVIVRKRGVEVARWVPLQAPFCGVYRVDIKPGYPVFAVRGEYGLGSHWDTMIFAIRKGRLIQMGRPPAMNSNGPILWHGHRGVWAFDNFDRYKDMDDEEFRLARVLMKVGSKGRLEKWKTIFTEHPRVPITIHTLDDLSVPKGGF